MSIYRGAGGSGDATNDATVSQVQTYASQAATSATNAASSATAAAASASGASTSATLATAAKNDSVAISNTVAGYVDTALSSATAATTSATEAAASAAAAAISEGGASGSASDALDSANTATTQATAASTSATNSANSAASALAIYGDTTAMNTAVTNAGNSATAAATSATNAATSASNASSSASAASSSASAASTSASAAATSAGNAATSASNASSSASAASSSASSASTSASTATTQASNAATSATNASNSASTATTQAGIATTGGTTATTQAGIATTQAGIATTGATTATTQAGIATTQASNASTSATNASSSETNSLANRNAAAASATNASTSASAAATSATSSATSASAAATSAAAASAVALGNEPVRHSVRPSLLLDFANTKQLDPRITFTRASTATFYDGKTTAKAEENLILQSQTFDNVIWEKNASSVTTNSTTAPDGTTTAETIIENSASDVHVAFQYSFIALATVYTLSVFLKADTRNFGMVRVGGGSFPGNIGPAIKVDLTNGTVTTIAGTIISSSATSVGNGWYRCTMTFTSGSATGHTPQFGPHDNGSSTTYTGNGTGSVFVWGAQLEQRSAVTAYTVTTTQPITNYIPALQTAASGVARFDHNPTTGESLGLLIEEQRVNLLTYSDDFNNAAWVAFGTKTLTSNINIAPDGTLTADYLSSPSNNGVQQSISIAASTTYTYSIYAKADLGTSIRMSYTTTGGTGTTVAVNTVISTGQSVGNGWFRIPINFTTAVGNTGVVIRVQTDTTAGIYIWGAQLEAGAFATSYIPTVASQVTRSPDAASLTGTNFSSWYRQDEFTLYADYSVTSILQYQRLLYLSNSVTGSTYTNFVAIDALNPNGSNLYGEINTATAQVVVNLGLSTVNAANKVAFAVKTNDSYGIKNGNAGVADTVCAIPILDRMFIGRHADGLYFNGTIKKIANYPLRLSNADLAGLTTV